MEIEKLVRNWGGEFVAIKVDEPTGALIVAAIHSTRLGPAAGGTRLKTYPDAEAAVQDALRLSAAMTRKFAVSNVQRGGGKCVIMAPSLLSLSDRQGLLRRYGTFIHQLGGLYSTAPDVGTSSQDMDTIAETGAPFVLGRSPAAGGMGDSGPITGLGVFAGIRAVLEHLDGDPSVSGKRVLVQGAGQVGGRLISLLLEAGADVLYSDVSPDAVERLAGTAGLTYVPPEAVLTTACDVFSPCALGGILTEKTIPLLRCRAVAGGANNQLGKASDADLLRARGILYAPDYAINAGGAIGLIGVEALGWSYARAEREVVQTITHTLQEVFRSSEAESISTERAAQQLADQRLALTPEAFPA